MEGEVAFDGSDEHVLAVGVEAGGAGGALHQLAAVASLVVDQDEGAGLVQAVLVALDEEVAAASVPKA